MSLAVLLEYLLSACILVVDHLEYLVVHNLCRCLRVGTLELILLLVVIADIGQSVTHAGIGYHAVSRLGSALQVVHSSCRYMSGEEFLGSTSTQQ